MAELSPERRRRVRRMVAASRKMALRRASEALSAVALLCAAQETLQEARKTWQHTRARLLVALEAMQSKERIWSDVVGETPIVYQRLDDDARQNLEALKALVVRLLERNPESKKVPKDERQ